MIISRRDNIIGGWKNGNKNPCGWPRPLHEVHIIAVYAPEADAETVPCICAAQVVHRSRREEEFNNR